MATFTNQATLSYNGLSVNSNIVTGQMVCPLSMTKTPTDDTYAAGDVITYLVSLVNDGSTSYENLTLTDDLGGYEIGSQTAYPLQFVEDSLRFFINGLPQTAPALTPGAPLVVTGLSVPAGGNALIAYEAVVTDAAPLLADGCITNTAVLTGALITSPLEASATVTVVEQAELSIVKGLFPATVSENGQLTYTFDIQNRGNQPAGTEAGITVTDQFDPILRDITVTLDGQPLLAGTDYTYNQATGAFQTVAGRITVPAATFSQAKDTGDWMVAPGETVLTVEGTV